METYMKKDDFQQKLYAFMYGRYGNDQLNAFLSIVSFAFVPATIIASFAITDNTVKIIVCSCLLAAFAALFAITTFRTLSKQIYKRRRENGLFLNAVGKLKRIVTFNTSAGSKGKNKDDDTYIFRDCTKCSCTLRLPRKKGRNKVKCPKCSHKFYVISKK